MLLRVVEIALLKSLCLEAPDPVTTEPFFAHRLQLEAVAASLPYESDAARARGIISRRHGRAIGGIAWAGRQRPFAGARRRQKAQLSLERYVLAHADAR